MSAPDIVAFLEARLAEVEARATESGIRSGETITWSLPGIDEGRMYGERIDWEGDHRGGTLIYPEGGHDEADAEHIVFWQPSRILALVASYRRIIDPYKAAGARIRDEKDPGWIGMHVALGEVLIDLASLWREHPDWHEDWEVEDR